MSAGEQSWMIGPVTCSSCLTRASLEALEASAVLLTVATLP